MIFDNQDKDYSGHISEEIKKYGNPRANLIITVLILIILAIIVSLSVKKKEITGITADYASFYPDSTITYFDINLNGKNIAEINNYAKLGINGLPDLLNRLANNNVRKREKVNLLLSQAFGNTISFGVWKDLVNGKYIERSLIISPIKREKKVDSLFRELLGRRLVSEVHKGFKITTTPRKDYAYLVQRNKIYLADSLETLESVIDNYIVGDSNSIIERKDVRESLNYLEKDRIATIIIPDLKIGLDKVSNFSVNNLKNRIFDTDQLLKSFGATVVSLNCKGNKIYLSSYTPYDLSKIEDKSLAQSFKTLLATNYSGLNLNFIPKESLGYIFFKGFKNYITLALELSGIKKGPEYDQVKQFIKMLTNLDFENDILKVFEKDAVLIAIDCNSDKLKYIVVLPNKDDTNSVISKLINVLSVQISSTNVVKASYKDVELNQVSSPKLPVVLCYGKISPELYAFGEKLAVESLINSIKNNEFQPNKAKFNENMFLSNPHSAWISAYINIAGLAKYNRQKGISNNYYVNKIENNLDSFLISLNTQNKVIKGYLQLNIKDNK